jgi:hypothetical protein
MQSRNHNTTTNNNNRQEQQEQQEQQPTILRAGCSWYTPVSCIVEHPDSADYRQ